MPAQAETYTQTRAVWKYNGMKTADFALNQ